MDPIEQAFRDQATSSGIDPANIEQILAIRRARQAQKKGKGEEEYGREFGRYKEKYLWTQEQEQKQKEMEMEELGGSTETERMRNRAVSMLQNDIKNYRELGDLVQLYSGVLEPFQILEEYNKFHGQSGSPWGPAKEKGEELKRVLGGKVPETSPTEQDILKGRGIIIESQINGEKPEQTWANLYKEGLDPNWFADMTQEEPQKKGLLGLGFLGL